MICDWRTHSMRLFIRFIVVVVLNVWFDFVFSFFYLPAQDVFLMIRRKKTTIFTDAKETTTVKELKQMIEGILKVPPRDQCLYNKENEVMSDEKQLQDYGIVVSTAKAQSPPQLGLALR